MSTSDRKQRLRAGKSLRSTGENYIMDTDNYLKAFAVSAKQFSNKKNESTTRHLIKQIDNLMHVKLTLKTFDPTSLPVTDFVLSLTELLNEPDMNEEIVEKIISFFDHLTSQYPLLVSITQSTFNIAFSLSLFLTSRLNHVSNSNFLECLGVLQSITKLQGSCDDLSDELLHYFIKNIHNRSSPQSDSLLLSLQILTNVCKHSQMMSQRVKGSVDHLKSFCKLLLTLISNHGNQTITLASLSLFTVLALNDPLGDSLFNSRNIQQAIELLLHILSDEDTDRTNYSLAIDLFLYFLTSSRIQSHLAKYQYLDQCLTHLVEVVVPKLPHESVTRILELLAAFFMIDTLRPVVLNIILRAELEKKAGQPVSLAIQRILVTQDNQQTSLKVLDFLIVLFRAIVPPSPPADLVQQVVLLLTKVASILQEPVTDALVTKWHWCSLVAKIFTLLTILLAEPLYRDKILDVIDLEACKKLIEDEFTADKFPQSDIVDLSDGSIDIVLQVLVFFSAIADRSVEVKEFVNSTLQDDRLMPFLANSLTSNSTTRLESGLLMLLHPGCAVKDFPLKRLTELMYDMNKNKESNVGNAGFRQNIASSHTAIHLHSGGDKNNGSTIYSLSPRNKISNAANQHRELESSVEELIKKMENGCKVKDMKASDIMSIYEHKLESFRMKEKNLHDLLETKSNALLQADKLLAQYRCRWAQSDAEAYNLRSLLKESEKRSEMAKEQTTRAMVKQQQLKEEYEQVTAEIKVHEKQAEERAEAFNELADRLEGMEKMCGNLREENANSVELNAMLQRHIESYKEKETTLTTKISTIEKERKNTTKQLKERESRLAALTKKIEKMEETLQLQTRLVDESSEQVGTLQERIVVLESEKQTLQEELTASEEVCGQIEVTLKEMKLKLKSCQDDLERQRQITAVIQNITSGRVDISMLDGKN